MNGARNGPGRTLERLFEVGTVGTLSDEELLERFVAGDAGLENHAAGAAFEAIVERHGPMVLRVCRTVLRDAHAAEDAFQATFLVLARRARTLGRRERLGNWLYGVALRTARKARVLAARRSARDRAAAGMRNECFVEPSTEGRGDELHRVLHEEIERLPGTYRAAVVACYLEGLTQEQAARRFQLAESTIRGRLARARKLLGNRLTRRGVAPAVGLAALEAGAESAAATFPDAIARSLTRDALLFARSPGPATCLAVTSTARELALGVLSTMKFSSLRTLAITTTLAAFSIGLTATVAGTILHRAAAPGPFAGAPPLPQEPREAPRRSGQRSSTTKSTAAVARDLGRLIDGTIVRTLPVNKDCMILAYLPEQNVGHVDNLAMGNNGGGVRMLIDWTAIPRDEVEPAENRFMLALYSRKTTSNPPTGKVLAFELFDDWRERNCWKQQPRYNPEPFAEYAFEPRDGWKLFDITPMVRGQVREGRKNHGILIRFLSEDVNGPEWSGYEVVSREGAGEWAGRHPVLLIVKDPKAKPDADR